MKQKELKPFIVLALFVIVLGLACSGSAQPQAPAVSEPLSEATVPVVSTDTPAARGDFFLVTTLGEVQKAVIQIEAEGTFIDPQFGGNVNVGKRGSGVIIDSQGIAITNNHVVTGGASFRVWVGGDTSMTYNARVLGVSECADLAVIDIDGDGFSYVQWFNGSIQVGQQVYAAGFSQGDSQFTLTNGILSESTANGETSWTSIDSILEHTASINPANSGGPLLDANGNLLGINNALVSEADKNYAIRRDEALPIIDQLRQGKNIDSIGVNGGAVYGTINDLTISGIWVRSVASGSPADHAGIQSGDIIYILENEVMATDGSMADYCGVLRGRNASDTMAVTVIRWSDLSLWQGQLNGNAMTLSGYFTQDASEPGSSDASTLPASCDFSATSGYLSCTDDTETITIDVPEAWSDISGSEWVYSGDVIGVAISASPDLEAFNYDKNTPGMFYGASDTFAQWGGYVQFLDVYTEWYKEACDFDGRYDYNDGLYKGMLDYYSNCDGRHGGDAYVLSAVPIGAETSAIIIITIQLPDGEDATRDHILNSFYLGDF